MTTKYCWVTKHFTDQNICRPNKLPTYFLPLRYVRKHRRNSRNCKLSKRYFWAQEKSSDKTFFFNLNLDIAHYCGCFLGEHLIDELIDFVKVAIFAVTGKFLKRLCKFISQSAHICSFPSLNLKWKVGFHPFFFKSFPHILIFPHLKFFWKFPLCQNFQDLD